MNKSPYRETEIIIPRTVIGWWIVTALMSAAITLYGTGAALSACTPAQSAEMVQIEQVILADVESGKPIVQIELDVTNILVGVNIQKTADEIVIIVNDVLAYILDLGQLPAMYVPQAESMHKQLTMKLNGVAYPSKDTVKFDSGLLDNQK
jgi:hypothetical protein